METENEPGMVRPWLLVVLVVVILAGISFFTWNYLQGKKPDTKIASVNSTIITPTPDTAIVVPTPVATTSVIAPTPAPIKTTVSNPTPKPTINANDLVFSLSDTGNPSLPTLNFTLDGLGKLSIKNQDSQSSSLMMNGSSVVSFTYGADSPASTIANLASYYTDYYMRNCPSSDHCTVGDIVDSTVSGYKDKTFSFQDQDKNGKIVTSSMTFVDLNNGDKAVLEISGSFSSDFTIDDYNKVISSIKITK